MEKSELISDLAMFVLKISKNWKNITNKKMFGCPAYWVNGNVFALVWKHGRIAVRLTDDNSYNLLLHIKGSQPWKAGPMKMANWVLVPESYHSDSKSLKKWLLLAYSQNEAVKAKSTKKSTKAKGK